MLLVYESTAPITMMIGGVGMSSEYNSTRNLDAWERPPVIPAVLSDELGEGHVSCHL